MHSADSDPEAVLETGSDAYELGLLLGSGPTVLAPSILLICRDAALSLSVEACLEYLGCSVTLALDGHLGLVSLVEEQPDLVLIDLEQMYGDGLTFLQVLRRSATAPGTPVVGIAGRKPIRSPLPEYFEALDLNRTVSREVHVDELAAVLRELA